MSVRQPDDVWLTFGYNTGVFNVLPRAARHPERHQHGRDGVDQARAGDSRSKASCWANERIAGFVGNVLIADHPAIADLLRRNFGKRRVRTITYGAHAVVDAPTGPVADLGLAPGEYAMIVCRPIPENSILEIVAAWSRRRRGMPSAGRRDRTTTTIRTTSPFGRRPSTRWSFLGAIYDPDKVAALRYHCAAYLHGHTVGGTNPSLVEAMAAGNAVVAHDNVTTVGGRPRQRLFSRYR